MYQTFCRWHRYIPVTHHTVFQEIRAGVLILAQEMFHRCTQAWPIHAASTYIGATGSGQAVRACTCMQHNNIISTLGKCSILYKKAYMHIVCDKQE